MEHLGITVNYEPKPSLDPDFLPIHLFNQSFLHSATEEISFALERSGGQCAVAHSKIHGTPEKYEADCYYIDRFIKAMLWQMGGFRITVCGSESMYLYLKKTYSSSGARQFDANFMADVYAQPFEVLHSDKLPQEHSAPQQLGRHENGCRIGFDAGGSDRKVSAVIDGEAVFSEEVVWYPKITADPQYHYEGILSAFRCAAQHMPRVDGIGISSAGVYVDNQTRKASLFLAVPPEKFESEVKEIYIRAAAEMGDVPVVVCNDGDVTALAGAMGLGENNVLGIAMGTSEAVGFVDGGGNVTGWLNELAFLPVDASPSAMQDEWSGDIGCGVKYFSQDGVIKLGEKAGIDFDISLPPAKKLKVVQELMEKNDSRAQSIYDDIGIYLGHTLVYYHHLYRCKHVLLLGRVMSGKGGDLILSRALSVLKEQYPHLQNEIFPALPDEKTRRVGQSVAAASLPQLP